MKLFLATPCYGGMVTKNFTLSLLGLNNALRKEKIPFAVAMLGNESLVPRARNTLAADFLQDPDATHLLFLDADMAFSPEVVFRLLGHGGKVVASACPKKTISWDAIYRSLPHCRSAQDLQAASVEYASSLVEEEALESEHFDRRIVNGFVKTTYAGTAVMLVERSVFTTLRERFPDCSYRGEVISGTGFTSSTPFYDFFETLIHPKSRRYLSEDYAFCHRWRICGGEVWLDVQSRVGHEGTFLFEGNPARWAELWR